MLKDYTAMWVGRDEIQYKFLLIKFGDETQIFTFSTESYEESLDFYNNISIFTDFEKSDV